MAVTPREQQIAEKLATRERQVARTLAEEGTPIEPARRVLERKQAEKVNGTLLDLTTASAIVAVADGLNDANHAKLLEMVGDDVVKLATIAWKLVAK